MSENLRNFVGSIDPKKLLVVSLLGAFGGYVVGIDSWHVLTTPAGLGGLLSVLASVVLQSAGQSVIKK